MTEGKNPRKYFICLGLILALAAILFASGAINSLAGGGGEAGPLSKTELRNARDGHLVPIRTLVDQNGEISSVLRQKYVEYPGGIQESYFAKVLRDGEAKHRDMKAMIDRLNRNNLSILAHLDAYGEPRTDDLKEQIGFFREHAIRYDQRWKALPQAAAKGAELPVAQPMFPPGFPRAVEAEISALDRQIGR
jgi:hypothetical protein